MSDSKKSNLKGITAADIIAHPGVAEAFAKGLAVFLREMTPIMEEIQDLKNKTDPDSLLHEKEDK